jgi:hypothetical protein
MDLAKGVCIPEAPLETIRSIQQQGLEPVMEDHLGKQGIVERVQIRAPVSELSA